MKMYVAEAEKTCNRLFYRESYPAKESRHRLWNLVKKSPQQLKSDRILRNRSKNTMNGFKIYNSAASFEMGGITFRITYCKKKLGWCSARRDPYVGSKQWRSCCISSTTQEKTATESKFFRRFVFSDEDIFHCMKRWESKTAKYAF